MTSGVTLTSSPTTLSGTYSYVYGPASGAYTVTNLGTIAATGTNFPGAVYLKLGGSLTNGSASDTTAAVTGFGTGVGVLIVGAPGALTNFGTIGGGTAGRGVELYDGGTVTNGSAGDTLAAIRGYGIATAVYVTGTAGGPAPAVMNYGTIGGTASKNGVSFGTSAATGTLVNGSTADTAALIISGSGTSGAGVSVNGPNGATIQNDATIGGPAGRSGIYLGPDAGAVGITNGSPSDTTALITGGDTDGSAVSSKEPSSLVNVVNYGTLQATAGSTVYLLDGGTITNGSPQDASAAIQQEGPHNSVYDKDGVATVVNYGTIGDSSGHTGISFGTSGSSGTVINGSTADTAALIISGSGTSGTGVYFGNPDGGAILNYATIGGPNGRSAVYMAATAGAVTITNGSVLDTNAVIQGSGTHSAIYTKGSVSDILNFGTIRGADANGVGFGTNAGSALVVNGSTADTSALITGGTTAGNGVGMANPASPVRVENYGTIAGIVNPGIYLAGGGSVINGSPADTAASIVGNNFNAIRSKGTVAGLTLTNFGTIENTGTGGPALYTFGGTITNGSPTDTVATMSDGTAGVGIAVGGVLPGPIANFGTILGETGIIFHSNTSGGTVINAGTIASSLGATGQAISFLAPGDTVVADPGAVFIGGVFADTGGTNVLELGTGAVAGTLSGLGTSFAGFTDTTVDAGANWQLTGANTIAGNDPRRGRVADGRGHPHQSRQPPGDGEVALSGGLAALGSGLATSVGISLAGPAADTLILSGSSGSTLPNTISGFGYGDRIEVAGVSFDNATLNGPQLDLTSGGTTVFTLGDISIEGTLPPVFHFGTDGATGDSFVEIACLAAGTRILAASGELVVEQVRAGMLIPSLAQARLLRVEWVGHRNVECARHPRPHDVWPVRIRAGAFGRNRPHRDLLLSPDHAVALPDERGRTVLIPARHLCNGTTIRQEAVQEVEYYHVELAAHGVIPAEGLACESYLDTGNRAAFVNDAAGFEPSHRRAPSTSRRN